MMVLQAGIDVFGIVFLILGILGVGYFLVLPILVFWTTTKTWKVWSRIVLFTTYFGILSFTYIIVFVLPSYFLQTYHWDFNVSDFHSVSLYVFFLLPVIYIGIIGVINLIRKITAKKQTQSHGHDVTVEGCTQLSGCKGEDKNEKNT